MKEYNLELVKEGRISYIQIPFNAKEVFMRPKGTIYVRGTLDNVSYRLKLVSKGNGKQIMIINKNLQKKIGFNGDRMNVRVTIEEDSKEEITNENVKLETNSNLNIIEGIVSRRSIRVYENRDVPDNLINSVINAGCCAPSAKNKRPWEFVVIKDKNKLHRLGQTNSNVNMIENSSCCIVVCGDKVRQGISELLIEDCSAATQNMLLAAHGLELGAVWCGVLKNSETKTYLCNELKLPDSIMPISIVVLGYPGEEKEVSNRFDPSKIHCEVW